MVINKDDSENSIILFPGQGCQYIGMGQKAMDKAPNTKPLFENASNLVLNPQCFSRISKYQIWQKGTNSLRGFGQEM